METIEPVLSVSVEQIYVDDVGTYPFPYLVQRSVGRSRLVIEGEDAIVAVLHAQAVAAAKHLREIAGGEE